MSQIRLLARTSVVYGAGTLLRRSINLLFLPVFTRILSATEYGTADLLTTLQALLILLATFGIDQGAGRLLYDGEEREHRAAVISTCFFYLVLSSLGVLIAFVAVCWLSPEAVQWVGSRYQWLLVAATFPFAVAVDYSSKVLRWTLQPLRFAAVNVGGALLQGVAALYFVVWLRHGVSGIFEAFLVSQVCVALLGVFSIRELIGPFFRRDLFRGMLRIGLPVFPLILIMSGMTMLDRYLLSLVSGREAVGLYGVASRLAMVLTFLASAVEMGFYPWAFSIYSGTGDPLVLYARALRYYSLLLFLPLVGMSLWAHEVLDVLVGEQFRGAWVAVFPICLAAFFNGLYNQFRLGPVLKKRTSSYTYSALLAGACNLTFFLLLVPAFGFRGAAWAMPLTFLPPAIFIYLASQKILPIPYDTRGLLALCTLGCGAGLAGLLLTDSFSFWVQAGAKAVIGTGLLACWYRLGGSEMVGAVTARFRGQLAEG